MEPKQQFIEKALKRMDEFKSSVEQFILESSKRMREIKDEKETEKYLDEVTEAHKNKINDFRKLLDEISLEARKVKMSEDDSGLDALQEKFKTIDILLEHPEEAEKELSKREELRATEPTATENLGTADVGKLRSKDDIEEELFKLDEEKRGALNDREKEEIQNKIEQLLRLYKDSSVKNKKAA